MSVSAGVAYTIGTGKLYCGFDELQRESERLLGRPVFTHEFANAEVWPNIWAPLKAALEDELLTDYEAKT
jgi:hypothetical protein